MFDKFIKIFIKNAEDTSNPTVRKQYGILASITGIILNIILCSAKIVSGLIIGAISIVSDGVNNLSDAGSSIITLLGFKLSSKKPDKEHPFGHGRMEYFAGLIVSAIIIVVAVELFIESVGKITTGTTADIEGTAFTLTIIILSFSILIKLLMALFNRYAGKKINSVAMQATSLDSISDCISTTVVLICAILSLFIKNLPLDGIAGIIVSVFIAFTGVKSIKEVFDILLGQAPDPTLIKSIADYTTSFDKKVVGIHDLMLHDYGPGRQIVVLHVEVPAEEDVMELHDMIDNIERGIESEFNCFATIHMDPVVTTSARVTVLKELCKNIVKDIDPEFDMHDFRMNEGETHANLIFDVVITHETKLTEEEIKLKINEKIKEYDDKLNAVITIEYSFV